MYSAAVLHLLSDKISKKSTKSALMVIKNSELHDYEISNIADNVYENTVKGAIRKFEVLLKHGFIVSRIPKERKYLGKRSRSRSQRAQSLILERIVL